MPSLVAALEYLELLNTVLGIVLGLLLLYSIRRFSGPHLGTYKHLLTIFAIVDTFLVIVHRTAHPRTVLVGSTHGVVTDTIFDDRKVTAVYVSLQSIPFSLLVIHFLYRYWAVHQPRLIELFSRKPFIVFLTLTATGGAMIWFLVSMYGTTGQEDSVARTVLIEECERKYGRRIENAWIVLDHGHDIELDRMLLVTILICNALTVSSITIVSTLAILTFHYISQFKNVSNKNRQLQRTLLVALCVQASVPIAFVYIPTLCSIDIPFFRLSAGDIHAYFSPIYTCFPVWDAAVIILLITDYRRGLIGIFWRKEAKAQSAIVISLANTSLEMK